MTWGSKKERETRNRIKVCIYAYTYEILSISLVDDATFDRLAREIDLTVDTDRPDLDKWFREKFTPYTGSWIWNHPELNLIASKFWGHHANNYATRRIH